MLRTEDSEVAPPVEEAKEEEAAEAEVIEDSEEPVPGPGVLAGNLPFLTHGRRLGCARHEIRRTSGHDQDLAWTTQESQGQDPEDDTVPN